MPHMCVGFQVMAVGGYIVAIICVLLPRTRTIEPSSSRFALVL